MDTNPSSEIRSRVASYLEGAISLGSLYRWVALNASDSHNGDPEFRDIAGAVSLAIAELTSGHCTESDVRESLIPLLSLAPASEQVTIHVAPFHGRQFSTASQTIDQVAAEMVTA